MGINLEFQDFSKELKTLSVMYGPPDGAVLLAQADGYWVSSVGLRRLADGTAEMKRMFVLPAHQGKGIGRKLTQEFIAIARDLHYSAIRLYELAGFKRIVPYRHNPNPDAVFMELKLETR